MKEMSPRFPARFFEAGRTVIAAIHNTAAEGSAVERLAFDD